VDRELHREDDDSRGQLEVEVRPLLRELDRGHPVQAAELADDEGYARAVGREPGERTQVLLRGRGESVHDDG
jgi:hypothetical protein